MFKQLWSQTDEVRWLILLVEALSGLKGSWLLTVLGEHRSMVHRRSRRWRLALLGCLALRLMNWRTNDNFDSRVAFGTSGVPRPGRTEGAKATI